MTLESDGHSIFLVVTGNGDVAVVERLFRASQVDIDFGDNGRVVVAQSRQARRPCTLK